jgi:Uncharacterized alpha/beta hydrolase domain (DUF2235)
MGSLTDDRNPSPATQEQLDRYDRARNVLASAEAPMLYDKADPRDRVFFALFDGTGNDADNNRKITNVGRIRNQLDALPDNDDGRIAHAYLPGPGTQRSEGMFTPLSRVHDLATGRTYDDRLEKMYDKLVDQVKEWKSTDTWSEPGNPDSQMRTRVVSVGFSRGAEQAAGFSRLVDERGIVDKNGQVLVPPGRAAQAVGLFDPVGTGEPSNHDRRMAHSVISGLQITADDERRAKFPVTDIIKNGITPDGSLIGIRLPGAHGDVGGSPLDNGLSNRSGNMMISYLNTLTKEPLLQPLPESLRSEINTVHRPDNSMLWRVSEIGSGPAPRDTPQGVRLDAAPSSFRPPTGQVDDNASDAQRLRAALDDTRETRRMPQSADPTLGSDLTWRQVHVPLQPTHPEHPDNKRYMEPSLTVDRAFSLVGSDKRPPADTLDQITANLALATKESKLTHIDMGKLENTPRGPMLYAIQGNTADLYSFDNRNSGVSTNPNELKPTMQALQEMEKLSQPQQQVAIAGPSRERNQEIQEERMQAPVMTRQNHS